MSKVREPDISGIPKRTKTVCLGKKKKKKMDREEEELYEPEVLDLSKVSTSVLMLGIAELMAEDAHERWASNLKKTSSECFIHTDACNILTSTYEHPTRGNHALVCVQIPYFEPSFD